MSTHSGAAQPSNDGVATRAWSGQRAVRTALAGVCVWIVPALAFAQLAGRVRDWFMMTDELLYERLAISIAQTGSPLPRLHGVVVPSIDQLYPLMVAPFFRGGSIFADLHAAHIAGAFVMTSTALPVYILARRQTTTKSAPIIVAFLAVSVPWMIYSSLLVSEVVAYPAFAWALLALVVTVESPSARADAAALAGLALAFLARTQLVGLVLVPAIVITVAGIRRRRVLADWRRHPVLGSAYAVLALEVVDLAIAGRLSAFAGVYGGQLHVAIQWSALGPGLLRHIAALALGLALFPVLIGGARMLVPRSSFEMVGAVTALVILTEVTIFDLRLDAGPAVYDRYLVYLAPVFLVAAMCALLDEHFVGRVPLMLSALLVCGGFALDSLPRFQWAQFPALDPDAPVAGLYSPLVHLFGSLGAVRVAFVLGTALLTLLIVVSRRRAGLRRVAIAVATATAVAIPVMTWYDVHRLVTQPDWAGRQLTSAGNGTASLAWVDRVAPPGGQVTIIPYHITNQYLVDQSYWRDLEYWNKSVARDAEPSPGEYAYTGNTFPVEHLTFNPRDGRIGTPLTPYVVQSVTETRFQIAGNVQYTDPEAMLIDTAKPSRVAWATTGIYPDGWLEPRTTAAIRVYADTGQTTASIRFVTLQAWAPPGLAAAPFTVTSNVIVRHAAASPQHTTFVYNVPVCVPPASYGPVDIRARRIASIPGDLSSSYGGSFEARDGSLYLADVSVSHVIGPHCRP